jgi:hypothetical protein
MDSQMSGYALPERLVSTQFAGDRLENPSLGIVEGVEAIGPVGNVERKR